MKAIRGAVVVSANTAAAIESATRELLEEIGRRNELTPSDVISLFFTLTDDLDADFPARAARLAGWDVPMLDMREVAVPGSLPQCLRVLMHVDRGGPVQHVYLGQAGRLRPDLA
ncbi:MAG: chorismate mutase [Chloroflexota bacterium]